MTVRLSDLYVGRYLPLGRFFVLISGSGHHGDSTIGKINSIKESNDLIEESDLRLSEL
jgi:hypothetical protein